VFKEARSFTNKMHKTDVLIVDNIAHYRNLIRNLTLVRSKDMITDESYYSRMDELLLEMDVAIEGLQRAWRPTRNTT